MKFNIKTFNIEQLNKENKYIKENYFSSLRDYEKQIFKSGNLTYRRVYYNGLPYYLYYTSEKDFDILLIPKNKYISENHFEDIVKYSGSKEGLNLSILRKNNNIVEVINYDFITDELGYSIGNYFHEEFDDINNEIYFDATSAEEVKRLKELHFRELINNSFGFDRIKRNENQTILNTIKGNSLLDAYESFDKNLKIINDNDTPILEILKNLNNTNIK